jgi:predicted NUDIX family phosphoesterase/thymidylate kinase
MSNVAESDQRTKNIIELERLAEDIIVRKKSVLPRRPIVIEFCGSPKAGKSSCISSLAMFLRRNEFRTIVISERGAVCPIRNKFDPNFNIWAGCSGLVQFSEIIANHSKYYDVVIMDRGFFDAICWFHWQRRLQKLNEKHYRKFVEFFLSPRWISKISLLYVFKVQPQISLRREHANLLTIKRGSIMNEDVLADFNTAIDECISEHGVHFSKKIRSIDTSEISQDMVSYTVTKDILESLNGLIVEKIAYFNKRDLSKIKEEIFDPTVIFSAVRQFSFGARDDIEADEYAVQPIPVAVITDAENKRVVVAKKLKSATSANSPERRRDLMYFGGHIREEDVQSEYGARSVADVAAAALTRELKEELDIDFDVSQLHPEFCIWNQENEHSAKHVALVYHVKVDRASLRVATDRQEFAEKGVRVIEIDELADKRHNFEFWSEMIFERILVVR